MADTSQAYYLGGEVQQLTLQAVAVPDKLNQVIKDENDCKGIVDRLTDSVKQLHQQVQDVLNHIQPLTQDVDQGLKTLQGTLDKGVAEVEGKVGVLVTTVTQYDQELTDGYNKLKGKTADLQAQLDAEQRHFADQQAAYTGLIGADLSAIPTPAALEAVFKKAFASLDSLDKTIQTARADEQKYAGELVAQLNKAQQQLAHYVDEFAAAEGQALQQLQTNLGDVEKTVVQDHSTKIAAHCTETLDCDVRDKTKGAVGDFVQNGLLSLAQDCTQFNQELGAARQDLDKCTHQLTAGPQLDQLVLAGKQVLVRIGKW